MPFIFVLTFFAMLFLMASFSNPALLLEAFVLVCITIYTVKSTQFFRRHITSNVPASKSLKDWIKVNAFVAIFFVVQVLASAVVFLTMKDEALTTIREILNQLQDTQGNMAAQFTPEDIYRNMRNIMIFLLIFDVVLAVHIFCTFKLLKKYRELLP